MKIGFVTYSANPDICCRPKVRDDLMADALRRRGVTVVGTPWDSPAVDWTAFDALVLRSPWNYYWRYNDFFDWIRKLQSMEVKMFNSPEIIRWNSHKSYLLDLQQYGVEIPDTRIVKQHSLPVPNLRHLMEEFHTLSTESKLVVVKPCVSTSAYETHLVHYDEADAFQSKFNQLVKSMDVLIQEFIPEIQSSGEWTLVYFDKIYSHAVHKLTKPGEFRIQGKYGGKARGAEPDDVIREFCDDVIAKVTSDLLYARVDVIRRDAGHVVLIEIELVEPTLYLDFDPSGLGANKAADYLVHRLRWDSNGENL